MNGSEVAIKPATTQPAKLANKLAKPPEWSMPRVRQSQSVLWFPDRTSTESVPAWVTKAGDRAINVAIIEDGAFVMACRQGVRHKSDPETEIIDRSDVGVWDFALSSEALNASAIREIGLLEGRLCEQACVIAELKLRLEKVEEAVN